MKSTKFGREESCSIFIAALTAPWMFVEPPANSPSTKPNASLRV